MPSASDRTTHSVGSISASRSSGWGSGMQSRPRAPSPGPSARIPSYAAGRGRSSPTTTCTSRRWTSRSRCRRSGNSLRRRSGRRSPSSGSASHSCSGSSSAERALAPGMGRKRSAGSSSAATLWRAFRGVHIDDRVGRSRRDGGRVSAAAAALPGEEPHERAAARPRRARADRHRPARPRPCRTPCGRDHAPARVDARHRGRPGRSGGRARLGAASVVETDSPAPAVNWIGPVVTGAVRSHSWHSASASECPPHRRSGLPPS